MPAESPSDIAYIDQLRQWVSTPMPSGVRAARRQVAPLRTAEAKLPTNSRFRWAFQSMAETEVALLRHAIAEGVVELMDGPTLTFTAAEAMARAGLADGPSAWAVLTAVQTLTARGWLTAVEEGNRYRAAPGMARWLVGLPTPARRFTALEAPAWLTADNEAVRLGDALARRLEGVPAAPHGYPWVVVRALGTHAVSALIAAASRRSGRQLLAFEAYYPEIDGIAATCRQAEFDGADVLFDITGYQNDDDFGPPWRRRARPPATGEQPAARSPIRRYVAIAPTDPTPAFAIDAVEIDLTGAVTRLTTAVRARFHERHQIAPAGQTIDDWVRQLTAVDGDASLGIVAAHRPAAPSPNPWEASDKQPIEPTPTETLDDLVASTAVRERFEVAIAKARSGRCVILLHGPPGTGKSRSASCLAGSLGRGVLRVTAADLRHPHWGVTESRVHDLFVAAKQANAVVVIDEADDWIGQRVRTDSPYAQQTATFLTELERFDGALVLTTNRRQALDAAVFRRIDVDIALDIPDVLERMLLWARAVGERELGAVDIALLSAVPIAGGDIEACVREANADGGVPALLEAARRRADDRRITA
jgi:hypothetical protein